MIAYCYCNVDPRLIRRALLLCTITAMTAVMVVITGTGTIGIAKFDIGMHRGEFNVREDCQNRSIPSYLRSVMIPVSCGGKRLDKMRSSPFPGFTFRNKEDAANEDRDDGEVTVSLTGGFEKQIYEVPQQREVRMVLVS